MSLGFDVPPRIVSRATCVDATDLRGHEPYQLLVFAFGILMEEKRPVLPLVSAMVGDTSPAGLRAMADLASALLADKAVLE